MKLLKTAKGNKKIKKNFSIGKLGNADTIPELYVNYVFSGWMDTA